MPRRNTEMVDTDMANEETPTVTTDDGTFNPNAGTEEWEWESKVEETPTRVLFDEEGDMFIGKFEDIEHVVPDGGGEEFDYLIFRGNDGIRYAINPSYKLEKAFKEIPPGTWVRITLHKLIDTGRGKGKEMKDFRVDVRKS